MRIMAKAKTKLGAKKRTVAAGEVTKLVRLKPYNPKRGYVLRKYTHGPSGKKFEVNLGWYRVPLALAAFLETVHQQSTDDESPMAFDVVTAAEAQEIDRREAKSKEKKDATEPTDLTTSDLRRKAVPLDMTDGDEDAPKKRGRPAKNR